MDKTKLTQKTIVQNAYTQMHILISKSNDHDDNDLNFIFAHQQNLIYIGCSLQGFVRRREYMQRILPFGDAQKHPHDPQFCVFFRKK